MTIIKLDAIDSTNDYLKQLSKEKELDTYTIVIANEQTKGKGQLGAKWDSEVGKNLLMSILVKDKALKENSVFDFNITIALAIVDCLNNLEISNVTIKWPNDIMADGKKIAGILIENVIKSDSSFISIVGIGLNVNQTSFNGLPNATSLCLHSDKEFESLEYLAILLKKYIEDYLHLATNSIEELWEKYNELLFQRNVLSFFEDKYGRSFTGTIKHVTREGKLALLQNDDVFHYYELKEIKMIF
jgi:BirA family transcriptional regulator, biotin operon repressor / biotin---[acetyl-CoA-carboxylase] ligase